MTVPALRVVAWSAALLGVAVAVVITLARTRPGAAPNISPAIETRSVRDAADVRFEPRDDGRAKDPIDRNEPAELRALEVSAAPPRPIPQNVEDLRVAYPLLAPISDTNERTLGAEDKDPGWSTAMETRIVDEISQKALGLELADLQVDCRTTLCRVEMTFPLQLLDKKFEPSAEDAAWNGRQPIDSFLKALDLDSRQPTPGGLNSYGTPVVVGYVNRPPEKTNE